MHKALVAVLTWLVLLGLNSAAVAQSIPYKPGRYSWKVDGGEIQLLAARYTNRNSFDNRAYTFYFESVDKKQFFVIPISGAKPGDVALTLTSSAGGDWLFSDLAVQRQGTSMLMFRAKQETPGAWDEPGNLIVERCMLKKGDEEDIPYQFVLQNRTVSPAAPRISVDEVLKQQIKAAAR